MLQLRKVIFVTLIFALIGTFVTSVFASRPIFPKNINYIRFQRTNHPTQHVVEYYRIGRSAALKITKSITNGGLYSIRNVGDGLYLTAKTGRTKLGPVVTKKWQDGPTQLWEINKLETSRGYSLKPLHNEFNSITSQLKNNTHSYHSWEFKNTNEGHLMIHDVLEDRCIKGNGNTRHVSTRNCDPTNRNLLWDFKKIE